jgi:hypothetical protein
MNRHELARRLDEMEIALHQGRVEEARDFAVGLLSDLAAARTQRAHDDGGIRQSDLYAIERATAILNGATQP